MNSVIVSDYGVMLDKTGEHLVNSRAETAARSDYCWLLQSICGGGLLETMRFEDYITISPELRSGMPRIKGTRITIADVLDI